MKKIEFSTNRIVFLGIAFLMIFACITAAYSFRYEILNIFKKPAATNFELNSFPSDLGSVTVTGEKEPYWEIRKLQGFITDYKDRDGQTFFTFDVVKSIDGKNIYHRFDVLLKVNQNDLNLVSSVVNNDEIFKDYKIRNFDNVTYWNKKANSEELIEVSDTVEAFKDRFPIGSAITVSTFYREPNIDYSDKTQCQISVALFCALSELRTIYTKDQNLIWKFDKTVENPADTIVPYKLYSVLNIE